jgi:hypothetical protein
LIERRSRAVGVVFAVAIWGVASEAAAADKQIRPFVGFTFAGDTTLTLSEAVGKVHATIGVNAAVLWEVFGVDVDVAHTPGFFQSGEPGDLVLSSSVTTFTGNVVVGMPRKWTEYVLRPYVVAGGGIMRIRAEDQYEVLPINRTKPAFDFGAGALGFITNRVGVLWEVRRFQTIGGGDELSGISFGGEKLSFWRATMAVAIRY